MKAYRKFLIDSFPQDYRISKRSEHRTGYIACSKGLELKLKQDGKQYTQTLKKNTHSHPVDHTLKLKESDFLKQWDAVENSCIDSTRYEMSLKGEPMLTLETYRGHLLGLYTVTLEFDNIVEAYRYRPPVWFGLEITYDSRFSERNLATSSFHLPDIPTSAESDQPNRAIGAIPYIKDSQDLQVVLVTNKRKERLIFPKGQPEPDMTSQEVAAMEAYEEAGVEGIIAGHPLLIPYDINREITNLILYPFKVTKLKRKWDDKPYRERKVIQLQNVSSLENRQHIEPGLRFLDNASEALVA